jgi:hypothetical protein
VVPPRRNRNRLHLRHQSYDYASHASHCGGCPKALLLNSFHRCCVRAVPCRAVLCCRCFTVMFQVDDDSVEVEEDIEIEISAGGDVDYDDGSDYGGGFGFAKAGSSSEQSFGSVGDVDFD